MRSAILSTVAVALALMLSAPVLAQERAGTLADIRQELSALTQEMQRLRAELSTTGSSGTLPAGGSVLDRIGAVESELARLTAKTEELEYRIGRIVADGTNRIGDLEFRLRELEGGDLAQLPTQPPLGGEAAAAPSSVGAAPADSGGDAPLMAVGEQADFDAARARLDSGDYAEAERLFAAFVSTYSGGPLIPEAHFLRGRALESMGSTPQSARAYLDAFNAAPDGPRAAEALLQLGLSLGTLDQREEACLMLREVGARFPDSPLTVQARDAGRQFDCP